MLFGHAGSFGMRDIGRLFLNIELGMGNMCPLDMDIETRAAETIEMIKFE